MLRSVLILMYHSVSNTSLPHAIDADAFRAHMALLKRRGYTGVALGGPNVKRPLVLTFDDGYADFLEIAAPIMAELDFRATVFVVANFVDSGTTPWGHRSLSWGQCKELIDAGFEIGSHTLSHPDLRNLSPDALTEEISGSKQRIEDGIGRRVTSFAYPFGYLNSAAVAEARKAGYERACAVRLPRGGPPEDRFTLQRIGITANDTTLRFGLKLSLSYRSLVDARLAGLLNRWRPRPIATPERSTP